MKLHLIADRIQSNIQLGNRRIRYDIRRRSPVDDTDIDDAFIVLPGQGLDRFQQLHQYGNGIAALRIGVVAASKGIIKELYKVKQTHDITFFSAKTGSYLLDHMDIVTDYVDEVNKAKDMLYRRLPKMGFDVLPSEANFMFFKCPANMDPKKVLADLAKKKIILKGPFDRLPFTGHLRVTVGTPAQMNMVCDELAKNVGER